MKIAVAGYCVVWGCVVHHDREPPTPFTFVRGAFAKTIADHRAAGTMPEMRLNHFEDRIIGRWTHIEEDKKGLRVEGVLDETPAAKFLVERGKMPNGLCINGFELTAPAFRLLHGNFAQVLADVPLIEISITESPCNPIARATFQMVEGTA